MRRRLSSTDPRIDDAAAVLVDYSQGLSREALEQLTGFTPWISREVLRAGREAGRLVCVYLGNSQTVWATAMHGKRLVAEVRAAAKAATRAKRRAYRESVRLGRPPGKLYEHPGFNPDDVPDLPVKRRVTNNWAPVRVAPGPTSIFNLGTHHA